MAAHAVAGVSGALRVLLLVVVLVDHTMACGCGFRKI
jgi:hypothetical protein